MLHLEGREVGGCKLVRKIGEGGMGEVYLGEQIRVGNRAVAVKIVRAEDDGDSAQIADIARRFQREASLLGNFSHSNILPVHDSGVQGDLLYLVMQYAPDGSLADAIKGRTSHPLTLPASPAFVADLIGQVASALQYTHDRGVVHRDVKPGNVLLQLEPNGHWRALLADFGIARGADSSSLRTKVSGTLAYMAPEQFSGKFSPASDQYALAVMTYQLLTGHTPFEGDLATLTRGHMYEAPPSVRTYNPALPATVDIVLARALAKDPAQRYPSVAEYAKALQSALSAKPVGAGALPPGPATGRVSQGPAPQWPTAKPPRERKPGLGRIWLVALAAVLLLVSIVGASGLIMRQQREQQSTQATQTAQAGTAAANASATSAAQAAQATQAAQQTAAASTVTVTTTPPPISQDMTTLPAPPTGVNTTPVFSDASPGCEGATTPWDTSANVSKTCPGGGADLKVTAQNALGCIQRKDPTQNDGYVAAIAQPGSGSVVLGFRQGQGNTTGGLTNITGYYFRVDPAAKAYVLYKVDANGTSTNVTRGNLTSGLAPHFAVSVLYQGDQMTLYINGVKLKTATDPDFSNGWMALCTTGEATYTNAEMHPLAS